MCCMFVCVVCLYVLYVCRFVCFESTASFFSVTSCMKNLLASKRFVTNQTVATRMNNTQISGSACWAVSK